MDSVDQRIFISDRRVSPPPPLLSRGSTHPTSLRSVCRILQYLSVSITADRAGRKRLGECFLWTMKGGTDPSITKKYSLATKIRQACTLCAVCTAGICSTSGKPAELGICDNCYESCDNCCGTCNNCYETCDNHCETCDNCYESCYNCCETCDNCCKTCDNCCESCDNC